MYGFRTAHCVRGIVMFTAAVGIDLWYLSQATSTLGRAIPTVLGAFCIYMAALMTVWLVRRQRGSRKIVVGPRSLVMPPGLTKAQTALDIPYAQMRDVVAAGGENGKLRLEHDGGTLVIERMMLATDNEFDELVGAVRKRIARA